MTLLSIAGQFRNFAPFQVLSDWRSRIRASVRTWSAEHARALAATQRYDALRVRPTGDLAMRDRASKARQVFVDLYAGK